MRPHLSEAIPASIDLLENKMKQVLLLRNRLTCLLLVHFTITLIQYEYPLFPSVRLMWKHEETCMVFALGVSCSHKIERVRRQIAAIQVVHRQLYE